MSLQISLVTLHTPDSSALKLTLNIHLNFGKPLNILFLVNFSNKPEPVHLALNVSKFGKNTLAKQKFSIKTLRKKVTGDVMLDKA